MEATHYDHIYLAPHLDDAALSCGGAITQQRRAGERVLVITLCAGSPDPAVPLSSFASELHTAWHLSPAEVVPARLREDALAMQRLDVAYQWTGLLDAIYRYPAAYNNRETLFGIPAEADPLFAALHELCRTLHKTYPHATFYAPLGIGNHVDHLITHRVAHAVMGSHLVFYEDFPYVVKAEAREKRLQLLDLPLTPHRSAIDAALPTKIAAIEAYASQLGELFGGRDGMMTTVESFARAVAPAGATYGEQHWVINGH